LSTAQNKPTGALVLSLAAGILILIDGAYSSLTASFFTIIFDPTDLIFLNVPGVIVIPAFLLLLRKPSHKIALGAAILVFSVFSFIKGGGFLLGFILGIGGGALAVLWKPVTRSTLKTTKRVLFVVVIIACVAVLPTEIGYQVEMHAARERLLAVNKIIKTSFGPIQYDTTGDGYPVLVVHGAGGGYDQGLILGKIMLNDEFRTIAPSRFGFLSTPIPADASPASQADAFAELLDNLNISKVVVIGFSAGGPSSLQFALRHPDRVSALVMASAISHTIPPRMEDIVLNIMLRSDFIWWLITENAQSQLVSFLGVSEEVQAKLTPAEKGWLSDFLHAMYPISLRQPGMANDGITFAYRMRDWPLEQITVPTLVIHAKDDGLVPFTHGEYTAQKIPGARLILLESGGHGLMGQHEKVKSEVLEFLEPYI